MNRKSFEIGESMEKVYDRYNNTCQKCGKIGNIFSGYLSVAHRIAQNQTSEKHIRNYIFNKYSYELRKKDIDKIIHHKYNTVLACKGNCNDSFNIFYNPLKRDNLIEKIYEDLKGKGEL